MLYGCASPMYRIDLSPSNLAQNPVPAIDIGGTSSQCAFNADYTVLYGESGGEMVTIDTSTGQQTSTGWAIVDVIDLAGSSVFGTDGGGGGDCSTQYASIKTRAAKTAKRNGLLRYRAHLKNGNKTLASIDELRLEVTLPPEVSIVSSSSSLKRRGVVGTAGASSFAWTNFNLTKHKSARFDLKVRVSGAATKGQVLTLDTTLFHERGGSTSCAQQAASLEVCAGGCCVVWTCD
jgi:hypothetical protein